tara:strand:+ start:98 stop:301 length:204 start_codon:yes stop_codon:yes gene_type:complete
MSIKSKIKLTSVKIIHSVYNKFRHISLDDSINLQKLVNRSILLYIEDEEFRNKVDSYEDLKESGSSF